MAVLMLAAGKQVSAQVGRVSDGVWRDPPEYQGNVINYNDRHFWVDIWVHNLGFKKEVGIIWSDNNWRTAHWADAKYELTYQDGAERWGLDVSPCGTFMWHRSGAHEWIELDDTRQPLGSNEKWIQYAIFYRNPYTGITYWDNNRGYNYWLLVAPKNGY